MGRTKDLFIEQQELQALQNPTDMLDADYLYEEWLKTQPKVEKTSENTQNS